MNGESTYEIIEKFIIRRRNNVEKNAKKKGFTLIELIVVIAILGILAVIAVPKLGTFRGDAVIKAHNANVRTLESVTMTYIADKGNPATGKTYTKTEVATLMQGWPLVPKGLVVGDTTYAGTEEYTVSVDDAGVITITPAKQ